MYNVILPTYNERENIIPMIGMLNNVFTTLNKQYVIIIVDDNREDGTIDVLRKAMDLYRAEFKNIKIISRKGKFGLGSAYINALFGKENYCIYEKTIIMDSDTQHNPFDLINMVKWDGDYDIVVGSRYVEGGKVSQLSFSRRYISSFANTLSKYVLNLYTNDLTTSFRIYDTKIIKDLARDVFNHDFGFQVEIIAKAEFRKYRIKEVPTTFQIRSLGESKLKSREVFVFLIMLVYLYLFIK